MIRRYFNFLFSRKVKMRPLLTGCILEATPSGMLSGFVEMDTPINGESVWKFESQLALMEGERVIVTKSIKQTLIVERSTELVFGAFLE